MLIIQDCLLWVNGRSGAVIDVCPFEVHHVPHVMMCGPSVYSLEIELPIYEIILSAEG